MIRRGSIKNSPPKNVEESCLVDKKFEISNLDLAKDIIKIFKYMDSLNEIVKT